MKVFSHKIGTFRLRACHRHDWRGRSRHTYTSCASKASLRRKGVRSTCGPASPFGGRDCIKSLRSSYTELYSQSSVRLRARHDRKQDLPRAPRGGAPPPPHLYLPECVYIVVLQKPIPAQICQPILHISNNKRQVDGFVLELILAKSNSA